MQSISSRKLTRSAIKEALGIPVWHEKGKIIQIIGNVVEAILPDARLGTIARIEVKKDESLLAEVVGFKDGKVLLLPYSSLNGLAPGCSVYSESMIERVFVGDFLLGQVVDSFLSPLQEQKNLAQGQAGSWVSIEKEAPNPLARKRVEHELSLGIRAIDSVLTIGEGQRVGIMAGAGVGKSVLLGMIARGSSADVNVIGLIGERGREVREFIEKDLGEEGLKKSVVIVVTGDRSPLMRVRGAKVCTAVAEYFSMQGKKVLMMMDSLTRVAMAQREIGLSVGEPPTTKGYTPSVFSLLPRLLERTGPQAYGYGSISALYTILVEGDDMTEPVSDAAKSILDGHIVLSRSLASRGYFPAIDVNQSISRTMFDIVSKQHWVLAQKIRSILGIYRENQDLIQIGAYQHGSNPQIDEAIQLVPRIEQFLKQDIDEKLSFEDVLEQMQGLL